MVDNTSNTNITLATPEDGVTHLVEITPGTQLTFAFDPKLVEYELTEAGDLLLTFKNGGGYTFKGFTEIEGDINVSVDGDAVSMSGLLLDIADIDTASDASKSQTSGQQGFEEEVDFSDSTIQPIRIEETVKPENGSRVVTQVEARDFDYTENVTYELLNHTDKFKIDSLTGEITVKEGVILENEGGEATFGALGAAYESNGIYTLTDATLSQDGAIWSDQTLNLAQDFSITTDLFLGSSNGADGITFVLHPDSLTPTDTHHCSSLGANIDNAVAVEFDTYRNSDLGDPWQDHVSINTDGDWRHGSDHSQAIQTSNLEDGLWHEATFAWDATAEVFTVTFEGQTATLTGGLSQHIADSTNVHFGFTGTTGGVYNLQQVNIKSVEGLDVTFNIDVQATNADTDPPTPAKVITIPVTITSSPDVNISVNDVGFETTTNSDGSNADDFTSTVTKPNDVVGKITASDADVSRFDEISYSLKGANGEPVRSVAIVLDGNSIDDITDRFHIKGNEDVLIINFDATQGDTLDISSVLGGAEEQIALSANNIEEYVDISGDGGNFTITVKSEAPEQVITIQDASGLDDQATLIQMLLQNN